VEAAHGNKRDVVMQLVDGRLRQAGVALRWAIANPDRSVALTLIASGVPVESANRDGVTPLHVAVKLDRRDVVAALLDKGADIHATTTDDYGHTALHVAAACGRSELIVVLLAAGADIDARDKNGSSPLIVAARSCQSHALAVLLDSGANIAAVDKDGDTALHLATFKGDDVAVKRLIVSGANVNAQNAKDETPVMWAAAGHKFTLVSLLVANGADPSLADEDGDTAVSFLDDNDRATFDTAIECGRACRIEGAQLMCSWLRIDAALHGARTARAQLGDMDDIAATMEAINEPASARLLNLSREFSAAEAAFAALQEQLRAAAVLDEAVIIKRDRARERVFGAASLLAAAEGAQAAVESCKRAGAAAALIADWPTNDSDDDGDSDDGVIALPFDDWLVSSRAAVAGYSETTEQAAHRLGVSLRAFPVNMCSGRAPADLPARMLAAALAGEREQEAIKGLKLPNSTAQALIELLEAKRAALVEAVQAVDRARQVHAVEAPNGERLKTAQRQVASKTKAAGIAKLQLDHADEDDDLSTLQAALRERKTECAAAQSELAAATIELAAHLFEFPELRLRFPTAPLDAFLAVGGEASALRPWSGEMCAHKSPEHTNLPRWVKEWSDCCDIDTIR